MKDRTIAAGAGAIAAAAADDAVSVRHGDEPISAGSARSAPTPRRVVDFDDFCRDEWAAVVGLAYVLTGSWTAAEDLAQDAFLAAFRGWARIGGYDKPGAWVRRVVANRAVSWRRRLVNESHVLSRLAGRAGAGREQTSMPEQDDALWAAVRRLPPRQAQVVALTYVEDLGLDQIAQILDIAEGTAKTHLRRARAALASAIGSAQAAAERGDHDGT